MTGKVDRSRNKWIGKRHRGQGTVDRVHKTGDKEKTYDRKQGNMGHRIEDKVQWQGTENEGQEQGTEDKGQSKAGNGPAEDKGQSRGTKDREKDRAQATRGHTGQRWKRNPREQKTRNKGQAAESREQWAEDNRHGTEGRDGKRRTECKRQGTRDSAHEGNGDRRQRTGDKGQRTETAHKQNIQWTWDMEQRTRRMGTEGKG